MRTKFIWSISKLSKHYCQSNFDWLGPSPSRCIVFVYLIFDVDAFSFFVAFRPSKFIMQLIITVFIWYSIATQKFFEENSLESTKLVNSYFPCHTNISSERCTKYRYFANQISHKTQLIWYIYIRNQYCELTIDHPDYMIALYFIPPWTRSVRKI